MPASFFSKIIPALSSTEHTLAEQSVQGSRNGIYIFATFAAWREIYHAKEYSPCDLCGLARNIQRNKHLQEGLSQRRKERKDNDTTDYVSKRTG